MRTALTIAGSDSSGGAGIQGDLKTFAALGIYGTSAITAITAQNTTGILSMGPRCRRFRDAQIEAIAADIELHAVKIGHAGERRDRGGGGCGHRRARSPERHRRSGDRVDERHAAPRPRWHPDADLTNCSRTRESSRQISRKRRRSAAVASIAEHAREAARRIHGSGPLCRHHHGRPCAETGEEGRRSSICCSTGTNSSSSARERIDNPNTHGTGCAFASALAAYLARGEALPPSGGKRRSDSWPVPSGHGPSLSAERTSRRDRIRSARAYSISGPAVY